MADPFIAEVEIRPPHPERCNQIVFSKVQQCRFLATKGDSVGCLVWKTDLASKHGHTIRCQQCITAEKEARG